MKDNFSGHATDYARFRPTYPAALVAYLASLCPHKYNALDVGTGNGQLAVLLLDFFEAVFATDISSKQIENATKAHNIFYTVQPAEKTNFPDNYFDLITVAQAIHWFDFPKFYPEIERIAKPNAIFAAIGYGVVKVSPQVDALVGYLYEDVLGAYWDTERRYIDEQYQTLPFPFDAIETPVFKIKTSQTLDDFMGYLGTWSAVKHFIKANQTNPLEALYPKLMAAWGSEQVRDISFPLLLKVGRVKPTPPL